VFKLLKLFVTLVHILYTTFNPVVCNLFRPRCLLLIKVYTCSHLFISPFIYILLSLDYLLSFILIYYSFDLFIFFILNIFFFIYSNFCVFWRSSRYNFFSITAVLWDIVYCLALTQYRIPVVTVLS